MAKSKYYGVTRDARINKWKVQIHIAGKPRFFAYLTDETDAANLAENARFHLQEFFPKPPPPIDSRVQQLCAPVEKMRETLRAEKAPTYTHVPQGAESLPDEVDRLFDEVQRANQLLQHTIRRLNGAFKRSRSK